MITGPSRQQGASPIAMLLGITIIVSFGTFAAKTIPAYLEFSTADSAINSLLSDGKVALLSESEVARRLDKRFSINNVAAIKARDLDIDKEGGYLMIDLDYEVRKDLFSNIDVVLSFKREYKRDIR